MAYKIRAIIDTDPGVDDVCALVLAFGSNLFDIPLICAAGGNSPMEKITQNTLHVLEILKRDIPVAKGAIKPLEREAVYAPQAQGSSGLGGYDFDRSKIKTKPIEKEAFEAIYETLMQDKKMTTLISLGPITNFAKLIKFHPDCLQYIEQIVFMGGSKDQIVEPSIYREFNVAYDPEASEIVLKSGIPIVMVPMELGHFAYFDKEDIEKIRKTNKIGKILAKMFENYKDHHVGGLGAAVHDSCAIYYLTNPEHFTTEERHLQIEFYKKDDKDFGFITNNDLKKKNGKICIDMNIDAFKKDFFEILRHYK